MAEAAFSQLTSVETDMCYDTLAYMLMCLGLFVALTRGIFGLVGIAAAAACTKGAIFGGALVVAGAWVFMFGPK